MAPVTRRMRKEQTLEVCLERFFFKNYFPKFDFYFRLEVFIYAVFEGYSIRRVHSNSDLYRICRERFQLLRVCSCFFDVVDVFLNKTACDRVCLFEIIPLEFAHYDKKNYDCFANVDLPCNRNRYLRRPLLAAHQGSVRLHIRHQNWPCWSRTLVRKRRILSRFDGPQIISDKSVEEDFFFLIMRRRRNPTRKKHVTHMQKTMHCSMAHLTWRGLPLEKNKEQKHKIIQTHFLHLGAAS